MAPWLMPPPQVAPRKYTVSGAYVFLGVLATVDDRVKVSVAGKSTRMNRARFTVHFNPPWPGSRPPVEAMRLGSEVQVKNALESQPSSQVVSTYVRQPEDLHLLLNKIHYAHAVRPYRGTIPLRFLAHDATPQSCSSYRRQGVSVTDPTFTSPSTHDGFYHVALGYGSCRPRGSWLASSRFWWLFDQSPTTFEISY